MALLLALAGAASAQPVPDAAVRASGRMLALPGGGWQATWPGVHWALRFEGQALAVRLDDPINHWVLEIDGEPRLQIGPAPGERRVWLRGLPAGVHEAMLIKRTESPGRAARVLGFELGGGRVLAPPPAPAQRIEFIGDSFTAGYGNLSTTRACPGGELAARSDASRAYAVLAARALRSHWRIHARSGSGLLRNWDGGRPADSFATEYARWLQDRDGPPPPEDAGWRAALVVLALGINDFSTPVRAGEPRTGGQLEADFAAAYRALIAEQRQRHGDPLIVLVSSALGHGDRLRPMLARLLAEQRAAGYDRIHLLDWGSLSAQGCDAHPDAADHRQMAAALVALVRRVEPTLFPPP